MGKDERRQSSDHSHHSRSRSRQRVRKKSQILSAIKKVFSPRLNLKKRSSRTPLADVAATSKPFSPSLKRTARTTDDENPHVGGLSFECEEFTGGEEWVKPNKPKHDQTTENVESTAESFKRRKKLFKPRPVLGGLVDVDEEANEVDETSTAGGLVPVLGSFGAQGKRPYQEDRSVALQPLHITGMSQPEEGLCFVAVYDGHGGSAAAEYCEKHLHSHFQKDLPRTAKSQADVSSMEKAMVEAFRATEEGFLNHAIKSQLQDGTVAVCALLVGETLIVGNVGDSRCVLSRHGVAQRLSIDHKPELVEEKKRVLDHGGTVVFSGCWRVSHPVLPVRLACSRSIGDKRFKDVKVISALPHVCSFSLSSADQFLILASDGVWDVISDQVAVDMVTSSFALYQLEHPGMPPHALIKGAATAAARFLVEEACRMGSDDNCTAVVVSLRWN